MSVNPSPIGGFAAQFFDNNGQPLSGGKIYTYAAGTTTPQATYTSALGVTPHANPIVLDSAGRVPGGEIWLTDSLIYKFVIETSLAVLIGTYDNITGVNSNFVNYTVQERQALYAHDIEIGGLLLCKTPKEMVEQRNTHFAKLTLSQTEAVDNSLMRQSDPRMPLFRENKSSSSFGKGA